MKIHGLDSDASGRHIIRGRGLFPTIAALALGAVLLSGCASPRGFQALRDSTQVCWHDICPGVTTQDELVEMLNGITGMWKVETRIIPEKGAGIAHTSWSTFGPTAGAKAPMPERSSGHCICHDDTVVYCRVGLSGLRLRHVIEQFGDPEAVAMLSDVADRLILKVYVLYPSRGIALSGGYFPRRSSELVTLRPQSPLGSFVIFDPAHFSEVLREPYYMLTSQYENLEDALQPWSGYGAAYFVKPEYAWRPSPSGP